MKPYSYNFKPKTAWITSSGQIESGFWALPGFKRWKEAPNSFGEKSSEILTASGAVVLQRLDKM